MRTRNVPRGDTKNGLQKRVVAIETCLEAVAYKPVAGGWGISGIELLLFFFVYAVVKEYTPIQ